MVALAQRMRVSIDETDDNEVQFLSLVVTARAYDATLAATNMDASRVIAAFRGALSARPMRHGTHGCPDAEPKGIPQRRAWRGSARLAATSACPKAARRRTLPWQRRQRRINPR